MGAVTPYGASVEAFWKGITSSCSAVRRLVPTERDVLEAKLSAEEELQWMAREYPHARLFTPELLSRLPCQIAACVPAGSSLGVGDAREAPEFVRYAEHAALAALRQAGLAETELRGRDVAVVFGTGVGNLQDIVAADRLLQQGLSRRLSPHFVSRILGSSAAGWIGLQRNMKLSSGADSVLGAAIGTVGACATGQLSITQAAQLMWTDPSIQVTICGATETAIHPVALAGFGRMRALTTKYNDDPSAASRPFDKARSGFVPGEGAGALCIEDLDYAQARGATILAEVRGIGLSCDGHHMSQPREDGSGVLLCMQKALASAGIGAEQVDHVAAHGTSTPLGDAAENSALLQLFGDRGKEVAVSSIKGHVGHLLGAAGIVQGIASVLAIQHGMVPPTANLEELEDGFDMRYIQGKPHKQELNAVLSNSFGFGGINTSVVFSRPPSL